MMLSRNARPLAAGLLLGTLAITSCATNPVTGKPQLSLISEAQEIQMGQQAAVEVRQSIGLVDDPTLQAYVSRVGMSMAKASERPNLPWSFQVVDDPTPNAFALPGGFIFVTRGLLGLMDSEAELATVLGHEIGHVTARHSVESMSRAQLAQLGLGIGMLLLPELQQYGQLASTGLSLLFLKYSRDDENQADQLGFRYALNQGYDVRDMKDVFLALERQGQQAGQSPLPNWLATHPGEQDRIDHIDRMLAQLDRSLAGAKVDRPQYLNEVNGLVYGPNPRNGFFQGTTFMQPDLRFRIDFPAGWTSQNLSQMVTAVSAQKDAALELTLADAATPAAAASSFFAQEGISGGQTSPERINGQSAVMGSFQAQTQQGSTVQGLATFVAYGGQVYRILGYASATQFGTYEGAIRNSATSFAPLTDPQALAVQPNVLRIVTPDRGQTLATFNQRYPSVISLDELAIINQVAGGSASLSGGVPVKRVVGR